MVLSMVRDTWEITDKPHTRTKLKILRKVFNMWLTVWGGAKQQQWVGKEWYVLDLFAGRGWHTGNYKRVSGSPLIFLEEIFLRRENLKKYKIKVKLFFVEKKKSYYEELHKEINKFKEQYLEINDVVDINLYHGDCNEVVSSIIRHLHNSSNYPLFIFVDPWGLQIKKETLNGLIDLNNPKDIMLNYILEGVRRVGGVVKKAYRGGKLNIKEIKAVESFEDFIGEDINIIGKDDIKILDEYVRVFRNKGLNIVGYDMPYPDRKDVLYYLLFASKKASITNIVKDIYFRERQGSGSQKGLFGDEYEKEKIFSAKSNSKVLIVKRKSLLYKTKVEYGDWTINHIIGCRHGCKFPCYAMMMAKKFGWVKNYDDWRKPRVAENAMEILNNELIKYKNDIKHFVHLCFMSDPFMYDSDTDDLITEIKQLTLKIIEKLNKEGIKVTTLTKGIYPNELLDKERFLRTNEYGITLVSLNEDFKREYEPYSAPYEKRIESLKRLSEAGLKTWASMEPYPTPQLPRLERTGAENVEEILIKIKFVKKIVFGKLNYSRLNYYNNNYSPVWVDSNEFYKAIAKKVMEFCKRNGIQFHIKEGTPLSTKSTRNIFKE